MKQIVKKVSRQLNNTRLTGLATWAVESGIHLQQIPAPTFFEDERAAAVAVAFKQLGLVNIEIDDAKNVYGLLKGINRAIPALMVCAHTDTVFPADTDLTIRREKDIIYGPGLGDNCMGVSGMLALAKWLHDEKIRPDCDICFVATSCEEGLGDLKGIRAAFQRLQKQVGMVINLEGLAFGHIYHAGIAVHRMHITAKAEGGHSWLHFGRPSATHAIMELGAQITRIHPPSTPRTTFNIGMINGGKAINAIATEAELWLDLRSEEQSSLDDIRKKVHNLIKLAERPGLSLTVEIVGSRPSGYISTRHPLVEGALQVLEQVNVRGSLETGSTDGNIPLQAGCPTVTIGITRGSNAHRLDEYIETAPVAAGLRQLIMLALSVTQYQREMHEKAAGD
ncbi:MAG: M20/M25/M40 family metallo-hydrolase [Anaerolineae bacterium]|nr:M20/M25/M40 family metallo-hydrolase [Anaerolineae bacterium]